MTHQKILLEPQENIEELLELRNGAFESLTCLILAKCCGVKAREKEGLLLPWRCELGREVRSVWLFSRYLVNNLKYRKNVAVCSFPMNVELWQLQIL